MYINLLPKFIWRNTVLQEKYPSLQGSVLQHKIPCYSRFSREQVMLLKGSCEAYLHKSAKDKNGTSSQNETRRQISTRE